MAIVAAMGYELSNDMARAAGLARELEVTEKRLSMAADSANLGMWEWDFEKDEIWVTRTRRAAVGFPCFRKDHIRRRQFPAGTRTIAKKSGRQ